MGAVGRMVGGGEVVQAIVTSAFPILRLDTVPLVALAVAGCCLLLLWVILRWRQEPQMPELRETCSVLRAAYCPCLRPSPPPTPNLTRQVLVHLHQQRERKISLPPPYEPPPTYCQVCLGYMNLDI